jgi:ribosomal-protein-alanine N-acetyltransferase
MALSDPPNTSFHRENDIILTLRHDITVRRYRREDAVSISHHGNNKKIWDCLTDGMPYPYTEQAASQWISHCASAAAQQPAGIYGDHSRGGIDALLPTHYAVTFKDEAIGSIGLDFGNGMHRRSATLGYWLGEEYWGKGIMGLVVEAYVRWAWGTWPVILRLNASAFAYNSGSHKCLEKAGFAHEGIRKSFVVKNGRLVDEVIFGALRPEI